MDGGRVVGDVIGAVGKEDYNGRRAKTPTQSRCGFQMPGWWAGQTVNARTDAGTGDDGGLGGGE